MQRQEQIALSVQGLTAVAQVVAGQHVHVGGVLAKDVTCRHNAYVSAGLSHNLRPVGPFEAPNGFCQTLNPGSSAWLFKEGLSQANQDDVLLALP